MTNPQNLVLPAAPSNAPAPEDLVVIGYICAFRHIGKMTWSYHRDFEACQRACVAHHGTFHPVWAPKESGVSLALLSAST